MYLNDTHRDTLIAWREDHDISLDVFNELLASLGLEELTPIQEVEVTVTFTVDVSELETFNKDSIEINSASIELGRSDSFSYSAAYADYNHTLDKITVLS